MLGALAYRRHGQHFCPHLEQVVANLIAHRHVLEHIAHLNGVLNRQGFFLLDLLSDAHHLLVAALLGEVLRQEFLKFLVNNLVNLLAGLRVLLDHLNNAFDLQLHGIALDAGCIKAHHTRAHAVNQQAGGVGRGAEELGVFQRKPQNRHLQARKPNPNTGGNALFGQDGLEHQGYDFNGGLFTFGFSLLLQLVGFIPQITRDSGYAGGAVVFVHGATRSVRLLPRLRGRDGGHKCSRSRLLLVGGAHKVATAVTHKEPTNLSDHTVGSAARTRQRGVGRHHARLVDRAIRLSRPALTACALLPKRRSPRRAGTRCGARAVSCGLRLRSLAATPT